MAPISIYMLHVLDFGWNLSFKTNLQAPWKFRAPIVPNLVFKSEVSLTKTHDEVEQTTIFPQMSENSVTTFFFVCRTPTALIYSFWNYAHLGLWMFPLCHTLTPTARGGGKNIIIESQSHRNQRSVAPCSKEEIHIDKQFNNTSRSIRTIFLRAPNPH